GLLVAAFLACSCDGPGESTAEGEDGGAGLEAGLWESAEGLEELEEPEARTPEPDVPSDGGVRGVDAGPADGVQPSPEGTPENPIVIPALPYRDHRDGAAGPSGLWAEYSPCGPGLDESGPGFLYVLDLPEAGTLVASLDEVEGDGVDMDVHILTAPEADACVARGHAKAIASLGPGTYWIAVDTWVDGEGIAYPGPYTLDVFLTGGGILPEQAGFNGWVVQAINDQALYPKDGSYPYCYSEACEPDVPIYYGMVHDGWYMGELLFEGTGRCYCCGHTLEIFLDAYRRWQLAAGVPETTPYGGLTLDDMDRGAFYQHWFGWGVGEVSSSANALEYSGIGINLYEGDWDKALPGDFVNLSRSTGTGHAVIFVDWVIEGGEYAGIRYYSCNGGGESHPDPGDPELVAGVSGPSFQTEYFTDFGGTVLRSWLFIGRAFDPADVAVP
ncbi:MAG: hypothetical protein FJ098_11595, partial [Deltaproteobacteria bacterium]|nr:hypothetical protein [Deltaproteobacteria bacterium]